MRAKYLLILPVLLVSTLIAFAQPTGNLARHITDAQVTSTVTLTGNLGAAYNCTGGCAANWTIPGKVVTSVTGAAGSNTIVVSFTPAVNIGEAINISHTANDGQVGIFGPLLSINDRVIICSDFAWESTNTPTLPCAPVDPITKMAFSVKRGARNSNQWNIANFRVRAHWIANGAAPFNDLTSYESTNAGLPSANTYFISGDAASSAYIYPAADPVCGYTATYRVVIANPGPLNSCAFTNPNQQVPYASHNNDDTGVGADVILQPNVAGSDMVCVGTNVGMTFRDNTDLNCNPTVNPIPTNDARRYVRVVYGSTDLGGGNTATDNIPNVFVGGVQVTDANGNLLFPGGYIPPNTPFGVPDAFGVVEVPAPVTAPRGLLHPITTSSPLGQVVGQRFWVRIDYWNICNDYDGAGDVANRRRSVENEIEIIAKPVPLTTAGAALCFDASNNIGAINFTVNSAVATPIRTAINWYATRALVGTATRMVNPNGTNSLTFPASSYGGQGGVGGAFSVNNNNGRYHSVWVTQVTGATNSCESDPIEVVIIQQPRIDQAADAPATPVGATSVCNGPPATVETYTTTAPNTKTIPATTSTNAAPINLPTQNIWSLNAFAVPTVGLSTTTGNSTDVSFNIAPQPNPNDPGEVRVRRGYVTTTNIPIVSPVAAPFTLPTYNINPVACQNANVVLAVTVHGQSDGGTISGTTSICNGSSTGNMTVTTHRGAILQWERSFNAGAFVGIVGSAGLATFAEVPPNGVGVYRYRVLVQNQNATGPCAAATTINANQSVITVNPVPGKPTITETGASDGLLICFGEQTVLQSDNPGAIAGVTYRWYETGNMVTPVQSGASNTLTRTAIAHSGTYVVQIVGPATTNCPSILSDPVVVVISDLPTASVDGGGAACDGNPAPDIIWTFSGGTSYNFTIDRPGALANIVVTNHGSATYTLSGQDVQGNYEIISLSNAVTGCVGTVFGGPASVISSGGSPDVDGTPSISPTSTCINAGAATDPVLDLKLTTAFENTNDFILNYTINGGANNTKTFDTGPGGFIIGTISFTETALNAVATHTIRLVSIQSPTGCLEPIGLDLPFTVNPLPAAPTSGGNVVACSDVITGATVSATPPGGSTIDWYTTATGGTLLAAGTNTFNPAAANEPTAGNAVTYFAESRNTTTGCISTTRTGVSLRSDNRPAAPDAGDDFAVCAQPTGPHTALLAADAATNGGEGTWTGPPGVTFADDNNPASTVSGLAIGANTLTWTVRSARAVLGDAGACPDQQNDVIVTVNALPTVTNPNPVLCETVFGTPIAVATDLTAYNNTITGGLPGRTVQWVGVADPTDHDVTHNDVISVIVTNTASTPNCAAPSFPITFSVVSKPVASNQTFEFCEEFPGGSNQAIDVDLTDNAVLDLITGIAGSVGRTVTWYHTQNGAENETPGDLITDANAYDILSGNETVYARVEATSGASCFNVAEIDLVIKPRPADPVITGSENQCVGAVGLYNVGVVAGATYNWSVDTGPGEFTVLAGGGPNEFITVVSFPNVVTGDIRVTLEVNGCESNEITKTVVVNATPPPVVITASADPVCSNQTSVIYTATSLPLTDYAWEIPAVGGATGSSIIGGQGSNQVTVNVGATSGNIRVVPQTQGGSCPGSPATFFIDVRQRPVMATYALTQVCSDLPINIDLTVAGTSVPAPTFRLVGVTVPFGLTPPRPFNPVTPVSSTEIRNDVFNNTTNLDLDVRYTVVPVSADGCEGTSREIVARIKPEPVLNPNLIATVCSGDPNGLTLIVAGTSIIADQFDITAINNPDPANITSISGAPATGITSDPNEIANDVWRNLSTTQQTIEYMVRPINSASGCIGDPAVPVQVRVNPQPQITSTTTQTICSGTIPTLVLQSSIAGSTFQWALKSTTGGITGGGSGTTNTISNTLVNPGSTPGTATYEVRAIGPGALGTCQGAPVDVIITVDPAPSSNNVDLTVCSDAPAGLTYLEDLTSLQNAINSGGGLTFSWHTAEADAIAGSNPIVTPTAYTLTNGVYVFARIFNGTCAKVQPVRYTINPTPAVTASITSFYNGFNVRCVGATDGTITADPATSGITPYMYSIDGSTFFSGRVFNGLSANTPYVITVRDLNTCTATSLPMTLTQPPAMTASSAVTSGTLPFHNGMDLSCPNATDGQITVTAGGGTGSGYSYKILETNATSPNGVFSGLPQGTYTVLVTDQAPNNCTITSNQVTITPPPAINASATLDDPASCNGASDAVISVLASGGTLIGPNYTITLNPGAIGDDDNDGVVDGIFTGLPASVVPYVATVVDDNNCPFQTNGVVVTQPAALNAFISITSTDIHPGGTAISCFGANDAQLTVTANGGNGGYSYVLNIVTPGSANVTGNTSGIYDDVHPGAYSVTVTDSRNCNVTSSNVTVSEPTDVTVQQFITSPISCNGDADGAIRLLGTGGTGTFTYTRTAGPPIVSLPEINASGIFSGLSEFNYPFSVSDVNGCTKTLSVPLTQPAIVVLSGGVTSTFNGAQISCPSSTNGVIQLSTVGGNGGYSYTMISPSTSAPNSTGIFNGLGAGSYTFQVEDPKGCDDTHNVTIIAPPNVTISAPSKDTYSGQDVSCTSETDAVIRVTAGGGTLSLTPPTPPDYRYVLTPASTNTSGELDGSFEGVAPGTYTVTASDANGCSITSASITINPYTPILFPAATDIIWLGGREIRCFGESNGQITSTPSGGAGGWTDFTISPTPGTVVNAGNGVFSGLPAGTYIISAEDNNDCPASTANVIVRQPDELIVSATVQSAPTCFDAADASVRVSAIGGTITYEFTINTLPSSTSSGEVASQHVFNGLAPNPGYEVTVEDLNGCTDDVIVAPIVPPSQPLITAQITSDDLPAYHGQHITCDLASDAIIAAQHTPLTGTGSLTYSITDGTVTNTSGQFTGTFSQLGPGDWTVSAVDINNCVTNEVLLTVIEPDPVVATLASGANHSGFDVPCFNDKEGIILVTVSGGTGDPFSGDFQYVLMQDPTSPVMLTPSSPGPGEIRFENLRAMQYQARVRDLNNCTIITPMIELFQPDQIILAAQVKSNYGVDGTDISCVGANDGVIEVLATIAGGAGITGGGAGAGLDDYTYTINPPDNISGAGNGEFSGLGRKNYTITAMDDNGCTASAIPVSLFEPGPLFGGFVGENQQICINQANTPVAAFDIVTEVFGGNGSYEYQWLESTLADQFDMSGYNPIAGATADVYTAPAGLTQTTHYMRTVRTTDATSALSCPTLPSNPVTITVNQRPTATIVDPGAICQGTFFGLEFNFTGALPITFVYDTIQVGSTDGPDSFTETAGTSRTIFINGYEEETTFTITSVVDRNLCEALPTVTIPREYMDQLTVPIIKVAAEFEITSANPQCSGSPFTFDYRVDPDVTYTFTWPDGNEVILPAAATGNVSRVITSLNTSTITDFPILLMAKHASCNAVTASQTARVYPVIIPNVSPSAIRVCSDSPAYPSPIVVSNNTQGGQSHAWTVTRVTGSGAPESIPTAGPDVIPANRTFRFINTSDANPAQYTIQYTAVNTDPTLGVCPETRSFDVFVYRQGIAKIGRPKDPLETLERWSEEFGNYGDMGIVDGVDAMIIPFENATLPLDGDFRYTWTFSNNNPNTPPQTLAPTAAAVVSYGFKNPGNGKRAILEVLNEQALTDGVQNGCPTRDEFIFPILVPPLTALFDISASTCLLPGPVSISAINRSTGGTMAGALFVSDWVLRDHNGSIVSRSNAEDPTFPISEPDNYTLELTVSNPDDATPSQSYGPLPVNIYDNPHADFDTDPASVVFIPDQLLKTDNVSTSGVDPVTGDPYPIFYRWDFDDADPILVSDVDPDPSDPNSGHSPTHRYRVRDNVTIRLTAVNVHGTIECTDEATHDIQARDAGTSKVPNAFTPNPGGPGGSGNEDGTFNDVFLPITKSIKEFQMQIFDRWGNLVFESRDQTKGWDGYDRNGNLMPAGVYVYKLVLRMANDQQTTQVGDVTLIR